MTQQISFSFSNDRYPVDTFEVLGFEGEEAVSELYRYNVDLLVADPDLDLSALMAGPSKLLIETGGHTRQVHGAVRATQILEHAEAGMLCRVTLAPRLWQLSQHRTNEIYLDLTVPEIVERLLEEAGLTAVDYELKLLREYRKWPFRCQHDETHFDFLSRILEHEGIYYFFVQTEQGEQAVFCDEAMFQTDMERPRVDYAPVFGLEEEAFDNNVQFLVAEQKRLPRTVILRDYNDEKPSLDVIGQAEVDADGVGEVNVYGQNILTPEEGAELARIRAEQLRCGKLIFTGESTVTRFAPGCRFELAGHPRRAWNRNYSLLRLQQSGTDPRALKKAGRTPEADGVPYTNRFTAIPDDVQFRPEPKTPRPQMRGTLHAVVDAEGDGQYAEIDEQGRYHILLPFDRQRRGEGKASHWVRMSQPFGGEREGMHFPLRKGTRVLLSFIGGDPDRPVITGTIPDAGQPSVVGSQNHTANRIATASGNYIEMEDNAKGRRIKLFSPHRHSYMHLGAPNHSGDGWVVVTQGLERKEILGGRHETVTVNPAGLSGVPQPPSSTDADLIDEKTIFVFSQKDADGGTGAQMDRDEELSGKYHIRRRVGPQYSFAEGYEYAYVHPDNVSFRYGNLYAVSHAFRDGEIALTSIGDDVPGASFYDVDVAGKFMENVARNDASKQGAADAVTALQAARGYAVQAIAKADAAAGTVAGAGSNLEGVERSVVDEVARTLLAAKVDIDAAVALLETGFTSAKGKAQAAADTGTTLNPDALATATATGAAATSAAGKLGEAASYIQANANVGLRPQSDRSGTRNEESTIAEQKRDAAVAAVQALPADVRALVADITDAVKAIAAAGAGPEPVLKALKKLGHIHIGKHDSFKYQEGNHYDFGGYWVYNLGNCYVEGHMTPSAGQPLNRDVSAADKSAYKAHTGLRDFCDRGGPDWASIESEKISLEQGKTWVEKSWGDKYSYSNGDSVEVATGNAESHKKGSTYDYIYGGMHEETKYNKAGIKTSFSKSGAGESHEWKYHPLHGALSAHSASFEGGHVSFSTKLMPTFKTSIDLSTLSFSYSMKLNSFSIDTTLMSVSLSLQPFHCKLAWGDIDLKVPGFAYSTKKIAAKQKLTELKQSMTEIQTNLFAAENKGMRTKQGLIDLQSAILTMFS